jgi:hypothetical protein
LTREQVVVKKVSKKNEMIFLNLFGVLPSGPLGNIIRLFTKIENISHILVWSSSSANIGEEAEISFIELPRLKFKFQLRRENNGIVINPF